MPSRQALALLYRHSVAVALGRDQYQERRPAQRSSSSSNKDDHKAQITSTFSNRMPNAGISFGTSAESPRDSKPGTVGFNIGSIGTTGPHFSPCNKCVFLSGWAYSQDSIHHPNGIGTPRWRRCCRQRGKGRDRGDSLNRGGAGR